MKITNLFDDILPSESIITLENSKITTFLLEKRGNLISECSLVLLPYTTKQLSQIMQCCFQHNISVVPQGGNTGLVGGSVAQKEQIIVSLQNMQKIINLDQENFTLEVEAGTILADINIYLKKYQLHFPLQLPSQTQCLIGGNISSNAGGTSVIKYGNVRDLILGLEVVLPDGQIFTDLNLLKKRNIGLNIKDLFIGTEGTLGVITKAVIKIFPKPKKNLHFLLPIKDLFLAVNLFNVLYKDLANYLVAFEFFNHEAYQMVNTVYSYQFNLPHTSYYLIGTLEFHTESDNLYKIVQEIIQKIFSDYAISNYIISEHEDLWDIRYAIPIAQKSFGDSLKHDVSVPISLIGTFVEQAKGMLYEKYQNKLKLILFGHIGDGNIHFNISSASQNINLLKIKLEVKTIIVDLVIKYNGTFSAEHGIGLLHKVEFEEYYPLHKELFQKIKTLIDNKNIMNPGKIL